MKPKRTRIYWNGVLIGDITPVENGHEILHHVSDHGWGLYDKDFDVAKSDLIERHKLCIRELKEDIKRLTGDLKKCLPKEKNRKKVTPAA